MNLPTLESLTSNDAPSFDEPLEMLLACHGRVRDFCRQLDALPAYLADHGLDQAARNSIAGIVRYFDIAGPAHHQDEEDELFPIIRDSLQHTLPKLERLHNDHEYLQQAWQQIRAELLALTDTQPQLSCAPLVSTFTTLYREHAQLEEEWLFPTAASLLSPDQLRAAGQRMAKRRLDDTTSNH